MGYIRLDMTTSKSLVAAHTLLFPKIIFLSVTSLSGHFGFILFSTLNWCMYVYETAVAISALSFFFSKELLLGLCLDHMLCCGVDLSCILWPAKARYCQPCAATPLMYRALLRHPVSSLKTTVVFPSLYVSTKENTMHKLGVVVFLTMYFV